VGSDDSVIRGGWYQASDGRWYLTEQPPAPGWTIGPDERWAAPPPVAPPPPITQPAPTTRTLPSSKIAQPVRPAPAPVPQPKWPKLRWQTGLSRKAEAAVVAAVSVLFLIAIAAASKDSSELATTESPETVATTAAATTAAPPITAPPTTLRPLTLEEGWAAAHAQSVYDLEQAVYLLAKAANARDGYEVGRLSVDVQQRAAAIGSTNAPEPVLTYCIAATTVADEAVNRAIFDEVGAWNTIIGASNIAKDEVDRFLEFLSISSQRR